MALPLLVTVDALLLAAVTTLWTADDSAWRPPAALPPDAASLAPQRLARPLPEPAALSEMLERPLFARDRRPADAANAAETGADPLEDVVLLGTFGASGEDRGVVLRAEGVARRVRLGETIGVWRLVAIEGRVATFVRGDERRELQLSHQPQPAAAPRAPPGARPPTPLPGTRRGGNPQVERNDGRRPGVGPDNQ